MARRRFHISPEGYLVISHRDRWDWLSNLIALCVFGGTIGLIIGLLVLAIMATPAGAATCSHEPGSAGAWTWRTIDGQKCWYGSRRVIPKDQLHWPRVVAGQAGKALTGNLNGVTSGEKPEPVPPSWLERSSDKAGPAEIYFLSTVNGRGGVLEAYPTLIWQQPWLSSNSVMNWPRILDIDRVPFSAWDKRIGQ